MVAGRRDSLMERQMSDNKERVELSAEDAIAMLPDGDYVHTFRSGSFMLVGADHSRTDLIETIKTASVRELAGEVATSMRHGLAVKDRTGWLFVATR